MCLPRIEVVRVVNASALGEMRLSGLQRLLLTTDATVTRLLEGLFGESIRTDGLGQSCSQASSADAELELAGHETLLCRETLLQGSDTGRNYLYAEACVVLDRLASGLREGLLTTSEPIGALLMAHRTETFREVLRLGHTPAGVLGPRLDMDSGADLVFRTYRIISGGAPIMRLTEYVPPLRLPPFWQSRRDQVLDSDGNPAAAGGS